ncbi:hypothetical protein J2Y03_003921 [Neobacillus niacini]|uniref:Ig-like domain-containing protein n=1 Tax=Neobacillus niacini TaxID=86668 RepID=UPI00285E7172|nr:Ig-like domain-containing protein [Neobacillus niacini]MDR7078864.1 hypothetical protein [Neobacillus niacini]
MKKLNRFFCSTLSIILLLIPSIAFGQEPPQNLLNLASDDGGFVVINNESTNGSGMNYTGTFTINNQNFTYHKKLNTKAYKMDVNKPINIEKYKDLKIEKNFLPAPAYIVGDNKYFWVTNFVSNTDSQISAKLLYSGTKSNIWVYNNQITSLDAEKLGREFDNKINPVVTTNFGNSSDVDGNGKVNILCYDILDGFNGNGGYIGGYFWGGDLYSQYNSNKSETFYIDTYPSMGMGTTKDVTAAYTTLAHEFQHMVNFNRTVFIEGSTNSMDTWLDEALSMAAEHIYSGQVLSDRIDYYNYSESITNGHSLLYWDDYGDVLANYSLSYLFSQYVKLQANQGDKIFKEILTNTHNDYQAVEAVLKKYISPSMSFGSFMTSFRGALLLKQTTGLYGFKGESMFDGIKPKLYNGSGLQLHGGGAVIKQIDPQIGFMEPNDKGSSITYNFLSDDLDSTPPAIFSINPVSDKDIMVSGVTERGAKVYVKRSTTLLGSATAGDTGTFTVTIPKQIGGTILLVYAEDATGNRSNTTSLSVKDTVAPSIPTVNQVGDNQTSVTGKAEIGANVIVKSGSTVIGQATTYSTGSFSVKIPKQKAGTKLTVYAKDKAGYTSSGRTVTVIDKTPPAIPTVSFVGDNQTIITGKTEPGAKVIIKKGTIVLGLGYASSTGYFLIKINTPQKAGTSLTFYASDKVGNQSHTTLKVVDKTPPSPPVVNKVTYKSSTVTGKAEAGATVYIYKGVTLIGKQVANQYGNFNAAIIVQKAGSLLEVSVLDKAGNQSKLVSVKVY